MRISDWSSDVCSSDLRADLTLIVENACSRTRARSVKISVGQHDHGRLAAQFQRDLLQISGRGLHDQLAHFGGTGEGDLVDHRMRSHSRTSGFEIGRASCRERVWRYV